MKQKNTLSKEVKKFEQGAENFAERVYNFFESKPIHWIIIACVFIVAVISGIETVPEIRQKYGKFLGIIGDGILYIFVLEMAFRIIVTKSRFFQNYWNIFDLILIISALYPSEFTHNALVVFRGLNCLNILDIFPQTRNIIAGFARAIPGLLSVTFLSLVFFYTFSLISTELYSEHAPELFGTLGRSMRTLFSMVCQLNWSDVSQTMVKYYPDAWIFLATFTSILGLFILNLIVGAIVNAMSDVIEEDERKNGTHPLDNHVKILKDDLAEIKQMLHLSKKK